MRLPLPALVSTDIVNLEIVTIFVDICFLKVNLHYDDSTVTVFISAISSVASCVFLGDRNAMLAVSFD